MRLVALVPLLALATPLLGQTEAETELLPRGSHDLALSCLALWVSDLEASPGINTAAKAKEIVFFSRLIAQKATAEEAANFDTLFAAELDHYRKAQSDLNNPATQEEADMDLTGIGKMCWFDILQDVGGPYEGQ